MAVPVVSDFLEWRWMPCVALTAGSLVFVGLAVLLIPSQIDGAKSSDTMTAFDRPAAPPSTSYAAALAQSPAFAEAARRAAMPPPLARQQPSQFVERAPEPPSPLPEMPANVTPAPEPSPVVDPNAP